MSRRQKEALKQRNTHEDRRTPWKPAQELGSGAHPLEFITASQPQLLCGVEVGQGTKTEPASQMLKLALMSD